MLQLLLVASCPFFFVRDWEEPGSIFSAPSRKVTAGGSQTP